MAGKGWDYDIEEVEPLCEAAKTLAAQTTDLADRLKVLCSKITDSDDLVSGAGAQGVKDQYKELTTICAQIASLSEAINKTCKDICPAVFDAIEVTNKKVSDCANDLSSIAAKTKDASTITS